MLTKPPCFTSSQFGVHRKGKRDKKDSGIFPKTTEAVITFYLPFYFILLSSLGEMLLCSWLIHVSLAFLRVVAKKQKEPSSGIYSYKDFDL